MSTALRVGISPRDLPGVVVERRRRRDGDLARKAVYDAEGHMLGEIVYVGRRDDEGVDFGWRPADRPQSGLTDQVAAIRQLDGS